MFQFHLLFRRAIMQKRHSSIVPPLQLTALLSEKAKNATALKVRFTSRFSLSDMVKQPTWGLSSGTAACT
jgi:hypothetical protein